ncbi:MAG: peptidylprolyl isomerase [Oscillospiraceae bacterium]
MKFRTRLLSLLLAGVMVFSLAACSDQGSEDTTPPSESPSDSAEPTSDSLLPPDFTVDTSVQDVCLATSDIPGDFALATVNGAPVTAYTYLYWLTSNISYLENYYGMTMDSDATLADYLKSVSLNAAVQYNLIAAKAKELGYDLSQEQIDELDGNMALTMMMMGGEEAFQDELRKAGFDYDTFYSINAASYYYAQLRDGLFADRPTAEEMDAYIEENDILYAKHILLMTVDPSTYEPLDEAALAEKKSTAEALLAQLQASGDLLADFDTLMNQYSEDSGLIYYPDGYTFTTAGEMVSEFEDATRSLEYGQISGLVESSYGYHIILRLDPDTEDARAEYRADLLYDQLDAWTNEADIVLSDEYEALDVPLFYEKYAAYQNAFAAEAAAEAEAEGDIETATETPEN